MTAGRRFFGALQEEILDAMEDYTDEELRRRPALPRRHDRRRSAVLAGRGPRA
jgi:hypothetical protein